MKILTFSFDDCEIYDRRVAALFRTYGVKATFFLISGQLGMRVPFHRYGLDTVVERVSAEEIPETYRDMEVASHTSEHRLTQELSEIKMEMGASLAFLSECCGYPVRGMAYPGGVYTIAQTDALREMGLLYARGANATHTLAFPSDWLCWEPSCRYNDPEALMLAKRFLCEDHALLHMYGHSYECTEENPLGDWTALERLLDMLAGHSDVLYLTCAEAAALHRKGKLDANR